MYWLHALLPLFKIANSKLQLTEKCCLKDINIKILVSNKSVNLHWMPSAVLLFSLFHCDKLA